MELAKNVKIKVAVTGVWGLLTLLISLAAGNAGYGGFSFSDFFMTFIGLSLPSCLYWLGFWIWGNGYISRGVGLPFRKDIKSKAFQREGLENEHPWRRYFAKMIDIILFSCVVGLVMGFVAPEFSGKLFKNEHVAGILILPFWLPVEALLMTLWGTTLAKWCMGIRVEGPAGGGLPYLSSLKRSCLAYVYGMALGIPLISLFTLIGSYMDIRKGNKTYWDKTCDTTVRYAKVRWLPLLLVLGAAGSVFYMGYASERDEKAMILFMATLDEAAQSRGEAMDRYITESRKIIENDFGEGMKNCHYRAIFCSTRLPVLRSHVDRFETDVKRSYDFLQYDINTLEASASVKTHLREAVAAGRAKSYPQFEAFFEVEREIYTKMGEILALLQRNMLRFDSASERLVFDDPTTADGYNALVDELIALAEKEKIVLKTLIAEEDETESQ